MSAARVVTGLVSLAMLIACPGRGSSRVQAPRVVADTRPASEARWTVDAAIAHRVLVLPSGDLLVLGQRRPPERRDPAHGSLAFVAVFAPDGALRWEHVHTDAWELAERAAVRDDGMIAVQGRSAAPDRDDRTWVRVLASDGTLRAAAQVFASPRPIGIGWDGDAVEVLGIARDARSVTVARQQVGGEKVATVDHDLVWNVAATLAAAGDARRSAAGRWDLWTDETSAHAIRLDTAGVEMVDREGDEEDDRDVPAIEGARPRLGPAVAVLHRGGGFVVRPRVPTADADARVEIAWSVDPEAELTRLRSEPADMLLLPDAIGDDAAQSFAAWRWHGLAVDEDGWDDALDRQPVAARALVRALARAGVCEAFAGESACHETSMYSGPPGFLTDVDDACRRREVLDANLPVLEREDVEALSDRWGELLAQLEVPGTPHGNEHRQQILDHIRTVGAAIPVARVWLDGASDDTARAGVALLVADGSPAALDALADVEHALWKEASRCTLTRVARAALAAAGRTPPARTVDRRDACELVFALCVLDDDALWAAALPARARTTMTCSPGYPEDPEQTALDVPCKAGTMRRVERFEMTPRAVETCSGSRAELDEPFDPAGNCGVSVTVDQRTIELAADRKGRHFIERMKVSRTVEGP